MPRNTPTTGVDVADAAAALLKTRFFGRKIQAYERIGSTNTAAGEWAEAGAPEGSVVLAEYQAAGRGRMGRSWTAAAGLNLTFSVILRPRLAPDRWGVLILAASLAVADTLERFASPLRPEIKWPNDVQLAGRKCCGMLLESSHAPDRPQADRRAVILGIGLNVNQATFDSVLEDRATSLLLETGRLTDRSVLLAELLGQLEARYAAVNEGETERIGRAYLDRLAGLGEQAVFRRTHGHTALHGIIEGITEAGALQLRTASGLEVFHAGEITMQESENGRKGGRERERERAEGGERGAGSGEREGRYEGDRA